MAARAAARVPTHPTRRCGLMPSLTPRPPLHHVARGRAAVGIMPASGVTGPCRPPRSVGGRGQRAAPLRLGPNLSPAGGVP